MESTGTEVPGYPAHACRRRVHRGWLPVSSIRALALSALLLATIALESPGVQALPGHGDSAPMFGTRDAVLLAGLLAIHAALLPFDGDLRNEMQRVRGGATHALARTVEPMGRSSLWLQASAGTFVFGKVLREPRVADLGLHLFLSVALSNTVTRGLKGLSGRSRPNAVHPASSDFRVLSSDPHTWTLFAGWGDASRRSYPSNHAATAFAVAAVLSEELGGAVTWLAYPIAGVVAWSRLHDDVHWASDVTLGAVVGIFSARLVVRSRRQEDSVLERWFWFETDPTDRAVRLGVQVPVGGGR